MHSLRVFLAAEEAAGARALQTALAAGHEVVGVLTSDRPLHAVSSTAAATRRAGVPIVATDCAGDARLAKLLRAGRVDLLLNVHSLRILAADVLEAPTIGCFNLHPGPLPRFAGLNAPSWAIFEGTTRYGCSLHWMTAVVDAGPIAYAAAFAVEPRETGLSLSLKCVRQGIPLIERLLADAAAGGRSAIPADEQVLSARRYLPAGPPAGGQVPWAEPAARVDALVRASAFDPFRSPWGTPTTHVQGAAVAIRRTSLTAAAADADPGTIGDERDGGVLVATADKWVLVEEVEVEGERATPAHALPRGECCKPAALAEGHEAGRVRSADV